MNDASARARQAKVLFALAARIERGESLLPADVFNDVESDLEERIDRAAVAEAWDMEPEPPQSSESGSDRGAPSSAVIARGPLELCIFKRAEHDVLALGDEERAAAEQKIDELKMDMLPRGTTTVQTERGVHLATRAGDRRVLYRVKRGVLVVVAVTGTA